MRQLKFQRLTVTIGNQGYGHEEEMPVDLNERFSLPGETSSEMKDPDLNAKTNNIRVITTNPHLLFTRSSANRLSRVTNKLPLQKEPTSSANPTRFLCVPLSG